MEWYDTLRCRTNSKMLHFLFLMFFASPGSGMPDEVQQNKYIIGGKDTNITEVPYQAALHQGEDFMCGATIVSERYLLTAAHCISSNESKIYSVRVGSSFKDKGGAVYTIKRAVIHPSYSRNTHYEYDYDVAFLEVEKPIKFNARVQPIPVAKKEPKAGIKAKISGYGKTETGNFPKQLQSAEVLILDKVRCKKLLNRAVSRRMICTTSKQNKICGNNGDSGGPLVVNGEVAGGASWFLEPQCSTPFIYSNFAEPKIRKFIRKNTGV